jgi:hypothetical protein
MQRLREVARRRGISMAALVREAVEAALAGDPADPRRRWDRASRAIGAARSGDSAPVARDHDRYLEESFAPRRR